MLRRARVRREDSREKRPAAERIVVIMGETRSRDGPRKYRESRGPLRALMTSHSRNRHSKRFIGYLCDTIINKRCIE